MEETRRTLSVSEICEQLQRLGVTEGDVLLVHSSYRAARPVEGGPEGLIEALARSIGTAGTLVMPCWTGDDDTPFDAAQTPASADLGILPELFRQMPGVERSAHPFAFAARGPLAARILADPLPPAPHAPASPVGRVLECGGKILLLGVGHDANSTLHLAEILAGVPYGVPKHITVLREGRAERIEYAETDHCCQLFALADDWLAAEGRQITGPVAHASSRLMRSADLIEAALPRLAADPVSFLHPDDGQCPDCAEAWRSIAPDAALRA